MIIDVYCANCGGWTYFKNVKLGTNEQYCNKCNKLISFIIDNSTYYTYDDWHSYYSCRQCGLDWQLSNDGTLSENEVFYCPKCGRYIEKVSYQPKLDQRVRRDNHGL